MEQKGYNTEMVFVNLTACLLLPQQIFARGFCSPPLAWSMKELTLKYAIIILIIT